MEDLVTEIEEQIGRIKTAERCLRSAQLRLAETKRVVQIEQQTKMFLYKTIKKGVDGEIWLALCQHQRAVNGRSAIENEWFSPIHDIIAFYERQVVESERDIEEEWEYFAKLDSELEEAKKVIHFPTRTTEATAVAV